MNPIWLIERGVFGERAESLRDEVQRQGMECRFVAYQPGRTPPEDILGAADVADHACVVFWGTLPLMRQIQLHRTWTPGGWCNVDNLDCSTYYTHYRSFLLNGTCSILLGVDAEEREERLFVEHGRDDEVFVRPNGVLKLFPGSVVHREGFHRAIAPSRYDSESRVVVSTPKQVGREWRTVIARDEVVAASQYRVDGRIDMQPGCPLEVNRFVAAILKAVTWRPDSLFALDVCESDGRLHVLELNSFSCSGLYECDLSIVVKAASASARQEWSKSSG